MKSILVVLGFALVALPQTKTSEKPRNDSKTGKARADEFVKLARQEAEKYKFQLGKDRESSLTLHPQPLLRWTNPVVGELYGAVFVWTKDGRPEMIASIFKWYSPFTHMTHEFQSLSTETVSAEKKKRTVWSSEKAGIEWKPLSMAPAVADSARRRLLQMRKLASEFSAHQIDKDGVKSELRLLTQPIFRYESKRPEVIDGSLFAFVEGTDPELVLLLEAHRSADALRWQYAIARMNFVAFRAYRRGKEIWNARQIESAKIYGHREPYTKFHIGKVRRRK